MFGAIRWIKKEFNVKLFTGFLFFIIGLIDLWSDMPNRFYQFKTEIPYGDQLGQMVLTSIVGLLFGSFFKAIILSASQSMIHHFMPNARIERGSYLEFYQIF